MHSLNEFTKSFHCLQVASVIAICADAGFCNFDNDHFFNFTIYPARAIAFTVLDVNEKIGPYEFITNLI